MLRPAPWHLLPLLALSFSLTACDSSDDDGGDDGIQPGDANAISQALSIAGATRIDGAAPSPSADAGAPDIADGAPSLRVGPGGTATVSFSVGDADDLAGFFLQVTGADGYVDAPLASFAGGIGSFAFGLPSNVADGDFEVNYCVYTDDDGDGVADLISNVISTGIAVSADGGGTDGGEISWNDTAVPYRGRNGERISFSCAAGGTPRTVWGTDVYTDDSSVCTAAVHAGAITVADGGDITVEILPGQDGYTGSERNGITSSNWGSWSGSFSIVD